MNAETDFISPERASREDCERQCSLVLSQTPFHKILNSIPDALLILNQNLQIVYCNSVLTHTVGIAKDNIFGKRPGEALNCVNCLKGGNGCGSSIYCRNCGLIKTILLSNLGRQRHDECTLILKNGAETKSLEVRLNAVPVTADHQIFTVLTLKNISWEKRKEDLQKTFVHDILNKIFILANTIENIERNNMPMDRQCVENLHILVEKALNVVKNHRNLLDSKVAMRSTKNSSVNITSTLRKIERMFSQSAFAKNKKIFLYPSPQKEITTDPVLLDRVLENLVKNALEASWQGQTVSIGFDDKKKAFFVHNEQTIPPEVQAKLFKSLISTKGKERGIGLYSVKFIVEMLLNGQVSFESNENRGTTFYVYLANRLSHLDRKF